MKLIRCHIDQFGKLSNQEISFSDGICIFHEKNAWGKSTLAAFLKAMLYGLESRKEPGTFEKERKRYRPWQGGTFGGWLEIEIKGKQYRIVRTFGQTEKADEFHLYDCTTNLESSDYSANIGEEIFELDAISFKRSIYIAQNDCESRPSDAINAKLGNLVENLNDINHYEKAQELLKNLANQLTPNRATGSIKKRSAQIAQLEQEILSLSSLDEQLEEMKQKQSDMKLLQADISLERQDCMEQLKVSSEAAKRAEIGKHYQMLYAEQQECKKVLSLMEQSFPNGMLSEELVNGQLELARKLQEEAYQLRRGALTIEEEADFAILQERFLDFCPTDEMIEDVLKEQGQLPRLKEDRVRLQARLDEQEKRYLQHPAYEEEAKTFAKRGKGFLFSGIPLMLLGLGALVTMLLLKNRIFSGLAREVTVFSAVLAVVVEVTGFVLFVVGIIRANLGRKQSLRLLQKAQKEEQQQHEEVKNLQSQEEEKLNRIRQIQGRMRDLLQKCHINCKEEDLVLRLYDLKNQAAAYRRIKAQKDEYDAICTSYEKHNKQFWSGMSSFFAEKSKLLHKPQGLEGEDALEVATQLQKVYQEYCVAQRNARQADSRLGTFLEENQDAVLATTHMEVAGIDELNLRIHELDERSEAVRIMLQQCSRQLEEIKEQLDFRDEKKSELRELMAQQSVEKERFDVVCLTQEYLKNAREQLTARYMKPLVSSFEKYYGLLLEEETGEWQIDANISFTARQEGQLRLVQQLSAGYQDLIGVCMRLALCDAMYPKEKPMLILDDPFVNLDEEKTARGMELLKNVAQDYQLIYFTCHSSRVP